jgi:hypothetical protein
VYTLETKLSNEDNNLFILDVAKLKWREYFHRFAYGLQTFIVKEDIEPPYGERKNIINSRTNWFSDIIWVYKHGKDKKLRKYDQLKNILLNCDSVRQAIVDMAKKEAPKSTMTEAKLINRMAARVSPK